MSGWFFNAGIYLEIDTIEMTGFIALHIGKYFSFGKSSESDLSIRAYLSILGAGNHSHSLKPEYEMLCRTACRKVSNIV